MPTNKPRKKPTSEITAHTRRPAAAGVLNRLTASELAVVLRISF